MFPSKKHIANVILISQLNKQEVNIKLHFRHILSVFAPSTKISPNKEKSE